MQRGISVHVHGRSGQVVSPEYLTERFWIKFSDGTRELFAAEQISRVDREPFGRNGGTVCDTRMGPCACGAWH